MKNLYCLHFSLRNRNEVCTDGQYTLQDLEQCWSFHRPLIWDFTDPRIQSWNYSVSGTTDGGKSVIQNALSTMQNNNAINKVPKRKTKKFPNKRKNKYK